MRSHVWTIPDGLIVFINKEFIRFRAELPPDLCIDVIGQFVVDHIVETNYKPSYEREPVDRYYEPSGGLNQKELLALTGPLEHRLRNQMSQDINFPQLHLACWAALLWCWGTEGGIHVNCTKESKAYNKALLLPHFQPDFSPVVTY